MHYDEKMNEIRDNRVLAHNGFSGREFLKVPDGEVGVLNVSRGRPARIEELDRLSHDSVLTTISHSCPGLPTVVLYGPVGGIGTDWSAIYWETLALNLPPSALRRSIELVRQEGREEGREEARKEIRDALGF